MGIVNGGEEGLRIGKINFAVTLDIYAKMSHGQLELGVSGKGGVERFQFANQHGDGVPSQQPW